MVGEMEMNNLEKDMFKTQRISALNQLTRNLNLKQLAELNEEDLDNEEVEDGDYKDLEADLLELDNIQVADSTQFQ